MSSIAFTARGIPVPQGALVRSPSGGLYHRGGSRLEVWRGAIRDRAGEIMGDRAPMSGPVRVSLELVFPRLRSHFRTGRHADVVRDDAPTLMATVPDIDKVTRSCLDALAGVVFGDDRQVAELRVAKRYGAIPGVTVVVTELEP